jgi:hypothetical protein
MVLGIVFALVVLFFRTGIAGMAERLAAVFTQRSARRKTIEVQR